jgi:hypothetical protein
MNDGSDCINLNCEMVIIIIIMTSKMTTVVSVWLICKAKQIVKKMRTKET